MRVFLLVSLLAVLSGCLPYAVGSTARTVSPSETVAGTASLQFVPVGLEYEEDGSGYNGAYSQLDSEIRIGLDERSDVGVRFVGGFGGVVTYKRRVAGTDPLGPGVALMGGGGFLNFGLHAHLEATVIASGDERRVVVPYGGLRAMQVIPIHEDAISDRPTLGGFAGLKIGRRGRAIIPEIGIYHDPSALELRTRNWIVVPSFTLHVSDLF